MNCPNCNGAAKLHETRRNINGDIRRRMTCRSCNYTWSEWTEANPTTDPDAINCINCVQWHDSRCGIGFPDPLREGLKFAADCSIFQRVRR